MHNEFFPPKKINPFYGYRTKSSMKSQERWDFAQMYSAQLMMKLAVALFIISILFCVFSFEQKTNLIIGFLLLMTTVGFMIYKVEKQIKINFPNN